MDCSKTENYLKEKRRMCETVKHCDECPFYDIEEMDCFSINSIKRIGTKEAIATVQKWSDEHPPKTYAQDFFEKFPEAKPDKDGVPRMCRANCYGGSCQYSAISGVGPAPCAACWGEPFEEADYEK